MKLKLALIILIIFQFSCKDKAEKEAEFSTVKIHKTESQKIEVPAENVKKNNFEKFTISNGQIGAIKVGMNISDAEKFLTQLSKTEAEAYDFGFDGGGKAYLYSLKDKFFIGLVPKMDSEEILAIIALSENLKTKNGLHPKSTVAEIQQKYPDIKINQNVMMGWEFMTDKKNNLEFVFMTNENNQIGEYKEIEIPVKPKRTNIKSDWITVK